MGWIQQFEGFDVGTYDVGGVRLLARVGGPPEAPPLVLLHGFPQTGALWHRVARRLCADFRLVVPDLRGYGGSSAPDGAPDHSGYAKRAMAADVVALMESLGHRSFAVAGHDRGGRVGHRLALDHPDAVSRLAVLDIAPTLDMYEATDQAFATAYYHWFHLVQPAPLPERMIGGDPIGYLHAKLGGWGARGVEHVEPAALAEYERSFTPSAIHAMCEDYRAAASVDLEHDRASRAAGDLVRCDLLVLWGAHGVVERLFDPVALWRARCAGRLVARSLPCGHFLPEEQPDATAEALLEFFG